MATFEHDGIRFFYRERGGGQPFVFQHGLGADSRQPFELWTTPEGYRLLGFDARGHGDSHPVGDHDKLGFATFAGDLKAFLDHLGLSRAVVGGISMGAGIALRFALTHPDRVQGLVLSRPAWIDTPCPFNVRMFSLISSLLSQHGPIQGKKRFLSSPEYREVLETWPHVAASFAGQFDSPQVAKSTDKFQRIIHDCPSRDRDEWRAISVPTLVLGNHQDPVHPYDYAEVLARTIPKAVLRVITPKPVSLPQHHADTERHITAFLREHFPVEANP